MRRHPVLSADIIRTLFTEELVLGVRHHHERWDGDGYPDGLRGEEIPEIARAMCVVDSYDAMSFQRPYRRALDAGACLDELRRCGGAQFDPAIVAVFLEVLDDLDASRRVADGVAAQAAGASTPASTSACAGRRTRPAPSMPRSRPSCARCATPTRPRCTWPPRRGSTAAS